MNRKQRWTLVAGIAGMAAMQVTDYLLTTGWRVATLKHPPDDPNFADAPWKMVLLWAGVAGAFAAMSDMAGRRVAEVAWRRVTGRKPPRPRRRPRIKSRREALMG